LSASAIRDLIKVIGELKDELSKKLKDIEIALRDVEKRLMK